MRWFCLGSGAVWSRAEEIEGEKHGRSVAGHDDGRRPVRHGNQAAGGVRHHPHGVAGAPRQLRLHGGAHEELGQETASAAAGTIIDAHTSPPVTAFFVSLGQHFG